MLTQRDNRHAGEHTKVGLEISPPSLFLKILVVNNYFAIVPSPYFKTIKLLPKRKDVEGKKMISNFF